LLSDFGQSITIEKLKLSPDNKKMSYLFVGLMIFAVAAWMIVIVGNLIMYFILKVFGLMFGWVQ